MSVCVCMGVSVCVYLDAGACQKQSVCFQRISFHIVFLHRHVHIQSKDRRYFILFHQTLSGGNSLNTKITL